MSGDTDPMLSPDPSVRKAEFDTVMKAVEQEIEADRARHRAAAAQERPPVIVGAAGFGDGAAAIPP